MSVYVHMARCISQGGVSESGQGYGLQGVWPVLPVAVSLARGGENIRDVTARFASSLLTERIENSSISL